MAGNRSPWRALRPVFLAGAATLTWLTFSASAASAEPPPDAASLLGGVTGSVSSVAEKLPVPVVAPATASTISELPVASPGLLQPTLADAAGLTDHIVSSVPVVNHAVPAGTVSVISAPIAQFVEAATAEVAEAVVTPVTQVLPVREPVLEPVSDLATGTVPLPGPLPELPVAEAAEAEEGVPADAGSPAATTTPAVVAAGMENAALSGATTSGNAESPRTTTPADPTSTAPQSALLGTAGSMPGFAEEQPGAAEPPQPPAQAPPAPGSGTGTAANAAASLGAAAWLSAYYIALPLPGGVLAGEISAHAPAPVSLDPGSSPD